MRIRTIVAASVTTILLVVTASVYVYRQDVIDWWKLRDYEPSPAIARLTTDSSFSDKARRLFYVHDPELLDKAAFVGKCLQTEETIVLGCYLTNTKIYIFDVNDERLEGVEEVTAAHEMLHAAYERLDSTERERIDTLTKQVYEASTDERLKATIESYRKRDESVVATELHSIIGTEVRELPVALEEYYSQYFLRRLAIVELAEAYASEFATREKQIIEYDAQLKALEATINGTEADLLQLEVALDTEKAQLESLRATPEAYNAQVPTYNEKVRVYNTRLQELRDKIAEYNEIVAKRNAIATEERALLEAIDSRPTAE